MCIALAVVHLQSLRDRRVRPGPTDKCMRPALKALEPHSPIPGKEPGFRKVEPRPRPAMGHRQDKHVV